MRLALGAGRARIVRQLMTESMIVVAGAAVPAFLASMWLMRLLSGVRMPLLIPVAYDFQPDARVLVLTTLLTGCDGPGFRTRPRPAGDAQRPHTGAEGRRRRSASWPAPLGACAIS